MEASPMKNTVIFLITLIFLLGCNKDNPVVQHDDQSLQIDYAYGFKDELNTFEGFLQKDLVLDGTVRVSLWLSKDEQNTILDAVKETQFFTFPDTIHRQEGVSISPDSSPDQLRISYNGQDKTVVWFYPMQAQSQFAPLLRKLNSRIADVIYANPTYRKLPAARGGYD